MADIIAELSLGSQQEEPIRGLKAGDQCLPIGLLADRCARCRKPALLGPPALRARAAGIARRRTCRLPVAQTATRRHHGADAHATVTGADRPARGTHPAAPTPPPSLSQRLDDRLEAELIDDGIPFNPLEMSEPDIEADLESRQIGGLGIHFVRQTMDEVDYRFEQGA